MQSIRYGNFLWLLCATAFLSDVERRAVSLPQLNFLCETASVLMLC